MPLRINAYVNIRYEHFITPEPISDYNCRIVKLFVERGIVQYIIASYLFDVTKLLISTEKKKNIRVL